MNKRKLGLVIGVVAIGALGAHLIGSQPANFHDQYITLPNGIKAYCNRQGYREADYWYGPEVHEDLVTDENGHDVACDARVGPDNDKDRVDENGRLLTSDEMDARAHEREQAQAQRAEIVGAQQRAAQEQQMAFEQSEMQRCHEGFMYRPVDQNCNLTSGPTVGQPASSEAAADQARRAGEADATGNDNQLDD